ncbi:MAG TPA: glucosamine-6-phosphate deaminase, partial [Lentisphaeria bacterium]|nr:glucosamine-6-phosphate deaminase [Lentisphaeria bacterium]
AVTMGLKPILAADEILLLACFKEQAAPLRRVQAGKVTPELPASYLNRHPKAEIAYTTDVIALS